MENITLIQMLDNNLFEMHQIFAVRKNGSALLIWRDSTLLPTCFNCFFL